MCNNAGTSHKLVFGITKKQRCSIQVQKGCMRLNVGIVEEADDAEFEILTRSSWPRVTLGLFCKSMGVLVNFANFLEKLQLNLAPLFVSKSEALQAKTKIFVQRLILRFTKYIFLSFRVLF